ncbi:hypothetical protein ALO65_200139 [Pseudomonas syringae pv. papulans]|nr:hypothetical protein ALO65_200139 [Pseudomonas syringae pv. papulans]
MILMRNFGNRAEFTQINFKYSSTDTSDFLSYLSPNNIYVLIDKVSL